MKHQSTKVLVFILLAALVSSQVVDLTQVFTPSTIATLGPEYNDPTFMKVINNYFGCKTWVDGFCTECSASYIFNNNGVCCKVDPNCQIFNRGVGVCEQCYNGFVVDAQGTCMAWKNTDPAYSGCAEWKNNQCVACSAKHYSDANGVCVAVSDQCREWDLNNGQCTTCYFGFIVNNGACVVDPTAPGASDVSANPSCKTWNNGVCEACADRTFFNANGICQDVAAQCNTWDNVDGLCLSCYDAYSLVNGACERSILQGPTDLGCKVWVQGVCTECSARWVFNNNGVCVSVSDICRTHDASGLCLTCYAGYQLANGNCQVAPVNTVTDVGCADWTNGVCNACSQKWVFDSNGICVPVSDSCRTNDAAGACTGCFKGYDLVNGACVFSPSNTAAPAQLGCKIWNWDAQTCTECSPFWYADANGVCAEVSALCASHDANGACTGCYSGFVLNNGNCEVAPRQPVSDAGCKTFTNGACTECSANFVFDSNSVCRAVSDQCMTHDLTNGRCTSCYAGYDLTDVLDANNNVVGVTCNFSPSNTAAPADLGCKAWANGACSECSANWHFDANNICQPVSDLCKTFDAANGQCLSCYPGYDLVNGACVFSPSNTAAPADLGCKTWVSGACTECSARWVFNNNQVCVPVSDSCATNDAAGTCLSCYPGYDLVNGNCEFSPSNTAAPTDAGCADWTNGVCNACSQKWVFDSNGICVPVSDSCRTNDAAGACTGCFKGYDLVNGACVFSPSNTAAPAQLGCKIWNWDAQTCTECSPFWYADANGVCAEVSALCASHDANGACTGCYSGFVLNNGNCEVAPRQPVSDAGCKTFTNGACTECSANFVFDSNSVCRAVSDQCMTHDLTNGRCTSCYAGYDLTDVLDANNNVVGVTCNFSPSNTAAPADLGCKAWANGACSECSANWHFDANNICQPVSDLCKTFDAANGQCLSCYPGYDLVNGACVFSPSNTAAPADLGCKTWVSGACTECSARWVFNNNQVCVPVSDSCATNDAAGTCLSCYPGYDLVNGNCEFSPSNTAAPTDAGCADWTNGVCNACSQKWVFDSNGICVPVSDSCRTNDAAGACTGCFKGYDLVNGACVFSPSNTAAPAQLGCKIWNWDAQTCTECSPFWYADANGVCAEVSALCASHDANGACTGCYSGFVLNNGNCEVAPRQPVSDAGCKTFTNGACTECSANFVFDSNSVCRAVSDQCMTHDLTNGRCTSCYAGYDLTDVLDANNNVVGVTCNFSPSNTAAPADLGCKAWANGACSECSANWHFDANNICQPVSDLCKTFDAANGQCLSCYPGYDLVNGACVFSPSNTAAPADLGCKTWVSGACTECSARWVFNNNQVCVPVSDSCATNDAAGTCLSCYPGYDLVNGNCEFSPSNTAAPTDAGCADWTNGVCNACSQKWVFDSNGICVPVSDSCRTNDAAGACTGCFKGYDLVNGACVFSPSNTAAPAQLGCKIWNWDAQTCTECSPFWYADANGVCAEVSALCASHDANGACTGCYSGFVLNNGNCEVAPRQPVSDAGCKTFTNGACTECSANFVFDSNSVCRAVSDQCMTHDLTNGRCTSCYAGYDLTDVLDANNNVVGVTCNFSPSNTAAPADLGCKAWANGACSECSANWHFDANNICQPVSDLCKTFDAANGQCLSCYPGYDLVNGACVFSPSNTAAPADLGCKTWVSGACTECSARWVFNNNQVCVPVSDSCATNDAAGTCLSCYPGYDLVNGNCEFSPSNTAAPTDAGCADWTNGVCNACSQKWVFDSNGICVPVSDSCRTNDAAGACTGCFKGYDLVNGACVFSPSNTAAPAQLGCKIWNWDAQTCTECSPFWYADANGVCAEVSALCASHDANGACTGCYSGFVLNNGNCEVAPRQPVSDAGCKTFTNGACTECSANFVFDSNSVCRAVSDQCMTHDLTNGRCTSCYAGYDLTDVLDANNNVVGVTCNFSPSNTAAPADLGCKAWANGACSECSANWHFDANNICQPVSDLCKTFDAANGQCLSCYPGYDLVNGACVFSPSNTAAPADLGCKTWVSGACTECSARWVFNNNQVCVPVSDSCATHDAAGACLTCYAGYVINNGTCDLDLSNQIPTDAGCANWDWTNQVCNSCSSYWVFDNNGVCVPVDPLCKTYDNTNGQCLTCWKGYNLNANTGACDRTAGRAVSDAGCADWNWDADTCLTCSPYWWSNNGVCTTVSAFCKTYDSANGQCQSCFSGYQLSNGECVLAPQSLCKSTDANGCTSCYNGFVLYQGQCVALDKISNIALYYAECCPQKLAQLRAEGRIPL